jgi:glycolate oxidase
MKEIIKEGLIEIVGKENYTDQIIDLVSYSYDASEYRSRPECAVWAESTDQISWILRLADKNRTPIVPRGAGTGLAGLSVPVKGGILLDLSRMDQIIRVSIPDRLSVVQPGVVYADLQEALASDGFFYPPDPASGKVCTLGGNVATNAGGLRGAKYGTTRDYVLALEVVLADGEVMRIGSQTMKCSSGYDLTRLFVGSEGTLGVVTEITLKISPKPTEVATAVAAFDRLEGAGEAVTLIMQSGVTPSVLELIDANTISVVRKHTDLQLPEVGAILLAEIDGNTQVGVKYQMEGLIAMFNRCHARNIETAHSAADAEHLWLARKSLGGLVGSVSKNLASEDVTVPMGRIAEFLRKVEAISKKHNLLILNFGHAGAGNFHPNILYDRSDSDQVNRLDQVLLELHELACKLGGTLTGEHGIGITKARFMTIEHDPAAMRVMRALKKTLDPNNILNPGKMDLDK